ncbi:MAG: DUF2189 domain-containing protein [Cognatishimia sp.]
MNEAPIAGVPDLGAVDVSTIRKALHLGWQDFRAEPIYGLFFGLFYALGGWMISWITYVTGQSYWLVFAAIGFPLLGPFAAVGLYEVSHRRQIGQSFTPKDILGVVLHQRKRQLPSICTIIVIIFMFWFFLAHMIFALFLGLTTMTNISSSLEIYTSGNGLMMLAFGTVVGSGFALILFMLTVFSLPILLDREVDFMTAIITSFQAVQRNFIVMLGWGIFLSVMTFVAMLPAFLGLLVALPWLGHASWHIYALSKT